MHLNGFTIEIYYDARPYERQICKVHVTNFIITPMSGEARIG